ncbi:hypothetical protein EYF80_035606 [Liparis tanakae]|uniref:Uncharacterized protein n=1 Tax=Liparis tanakae TaxID=230148 RepID=A0A4Z2GKP8_9TELE|nr:hypothetical protein EYF80_035606 [Liparis tanakae]
MAPEAAAYTACRKNRHCLYPKPPQAEVGRLAGLIDFIHRRAEHGPVVRHHRVRERLIAMATAVAENNVRCCCKAGPPVALPPFIDSLLRAYREISPIGKPMLNPPPPLPPPIFIPTGEGSRDGSLELERERLRR